MPVILRSSAQIAQLRAAGRLVAETFDVLRPLIRPGVAASELDAAAEAFIRSRGAIPAYKGYRGFPATLCISPNSVICHGIPSHYRLNDGDIVGIDMGVVLDGWYGDACITVGVGTIADDARRLLEVTEAAMWRGIAAARGGAHLGDVGEAIQRHVEAHGFSVVREYTGHGIGQKLHDEPTVLHYGRRGQGLRLRPGLVFTIEPMVNAGAAATRLDAVDGWTVRTDDGSLSAQFEHTIVITDGEPQVLTLP